MAVLLSDFQPAGFDCGIHAAQILVEERLEAGVEFGAFEAAVSAFFDGLDIHRHLGFFQRGREGFRLVV